MSCRWLLLSPPASNTITDRPRWTRYTRYPGPQSIRSSSTPSPTDLESPRLPRDNRRKRAPILCRASVSRSPANHRRYSAVWRISNIPSVSFKIRACNQSGTTTLWAPIVPGTEELGSQPMVGLWVGQLGFTSSPQPSRTCCTRCRPGRPWRAGNRRGAFRRPQRKRTRICPKPGRSSSAPGRPQLGGSASPPTTRPATPQARPSRTPAHPHTHTWAPRCSARRSRSRTSCASRGSCRSARR